MTPIEASRATCVWRHGAHRCFKKGLAAGWTALTLLSVLSGDRMVALAQQPAENSHVGKRVITQPGTVLKVGNQVVDDEGLGKERARGKNQNVFRTYMVKQANGPWLFLVAEGSSAKGWAPAANVILFDQAIDYITGQIRAKPGDWAKYVWRANVWLKRNELDTAIADYNEAIRLNPGSAGVAHQGRGRAWRGKKDYDKAIADCNEAIRLDPGHALAYYTRGVVWSDKKDYDKAIADYNEAIRLDPGNERAYNGRGNAWQRKKDYDKAIADYNEAIRLDPEYAHAYNGRGKTWMPRRITTRPLPTTTRPSGSTLGLYAPITTAAWHFSLPDRRKWARTRGKCSSLKGGGASIHSMPCSGAISVYGGPAMQTQRRGCSTMLRPGATPRPGLIR